MRAWVGTSGFSFKPWKGPFYPEDLPDREMLGYYATRLATVEINNTFYSLPRAASVEAWAAQTPADTFRFAIKASQKITHWKRLVAAEEETRYLLSAIRSLGTRLGAVLYQLPPNLKVDLSRLESFLDLLAAEAPEIRGAFEFRHPSWANAETLALLGSRGAAWVLAETDEEPLEALAHLGGLGIRPTASRGLRRAGSRHVGEAASRSGLGGSFRVLQARGRGQGSEAGGRVRPPVGPLSRPRSTPGPTMLDKLEQGNGLRTVFQPIYELGEAGRAGVHGYEALTRGPEGTPYESPARLFELARREGRETVLDLACAHAAFGAAAGLPSPMRLFVNVQISSLVRDPEFADRLLADARRSGVDLKRLTVELIERHVLRPERELLAALGRFRDAGVSIAVDDFGVGLATLELVIAFTPDYIKLDGAIARGVAQDRRRRIVVGTIVHMARQLHARVIAEGLEDAEDVLAAAQLGVALAQGRVLGREGPSPTDTKLPSIDSSGRR